MHGFGMRVSLGASSRNLLSVVMRQGVLLAAARVVIGIGCALVFGGVMNSPLYGVSAWDPLTLIGVGT